MGSTDSSFCDGIGKKNSPFKLTGPTRSSRYILQLEDSLKGLGDDLGRQLRTEGPGGQGVRFSFGQERSIPEACANAFF